MKYNLIENYTIRPNRVLVERQKSIEDVQQLR